MKKILVVTDNLRNQINGVVTTFNNLSECAKKDGYDIHYIDPSMFRHIDSPGYPEVKLSFPWNIGKHIKNMEPDYIHIATEGPLGLAARIWCDKRNIKYNTSYHTKFPEFLKKLYNIPEKITYSYVRWFHKHSGKVLTTTQTMVDDLKLHGFDGDIIPWTRGVDRTIFKRTDRTFIKPITLLSVGRVSKEKNIDEFCKLQLKNFRANKIVVGDGPYLDELKKKYPKVKFVGAKTGKELASYFSEADVFVFTSKTDTFGIVIIESLSVGTPVAAYPVPGPIDILEQGVTGFMNDELIDAVEACLYLDRDTVYKNSSKWTWENCWEIFKNNLIKSD